MTKKRQLICLVITLIFISACATTPTKPAATGNPEKLVNQLGEDLASARSKKLDVLAPNWFGKAQSSYNKAKTALDKGAKMSDITEYVAEANTSLKKAKEVAQISATILGTTSEARDKALKVGADKLGEPFMKVEKQYLKLNEAIENDNMSYAQKNAATVAAAFRELELMAIKNTALGDVRKIMANAEKEKIQKTAPKVYGDALNALNEADAYIGQNPYSTDTIKQKTAKAAFMARRMLSVSGSVNKLDGMAAEDSAIYLESTLGRFSKAMGTGDLRDKPVEGQMDVLLGTANEMRQTNASLKAKNQEYQSQLTGMKDFSLQQEAAKKKLMADRDFNERFNKVQQYFGPKEAEVYKQGNKLVIRMRGIKFPVGQATLTPDNYDLLSKVQKAIQTFGQPGVTIEGHTDSTGSAEINQALSQQRAEAVKSYLVANNTLPSNRIQAIGYGPDRPLAPNTEPEGRAINRRIDVVITPDETR